MPRKTPKLKKKGYGGDLYIAPRLEGKVKNRAIKPKKKAPGSRWSARVTKESNALDLEPGVFTLDDPKKIAQSLRKSAYESTRRKGRPLQSAMSMLNFYMNRAGKSLSKGRRKTLNKAKAELRLMFAP